VHVDKHLNASYDDAFIDFLLIARSGCMLRGAGGGFAQTAARFMHAECFYTADASCHSLLHMWKK
jgi:hypothetical protein